eukprot:5283-Heterococcus_DN1.PRE.6
MQAYKGERSNHKETAAYSPSHGLSTLQQVLNVSCATHLFLFIQAQLDLLTEASVAKTGKTLLQYVSGDVSGSFGKMMAYSLMDIDDYGAKVFTAATKGV